MTFEHLQVVLALVAAASGVYSVYLHSGYREYVALTAVALTLLAVTVMLQQTP